MVTVYVEKNNPPDLPFVLMFWPNFRFPLKQNRLFLEEIMAQYDKPFFELSDTPEQADFFAVPYEYFFVREKPYFTDVLQKAKTFKKKVLLFDYTDYVEKESNLPPDTVLFRVSAYRHHKKEREIIMPYFVEDLGSRYDIAPQARGTQPLVGYCGYARFGSLVRAVRAALRSFAEKARLYLRRDAMPSVHQRGLFWRKKAIRGIKISDLPHAIIERPFYSGHRASVPIDEKTIRAEYVDNLRNSDLALCVRGDANASQRFFEALSAGRIPLFLDTDAVLPLEEVVGYRRCLVCVPSRDVHRIGAYVHAWWTKTDETAYRAAQQEAKALFQKYLRLDRYFELVFDRVRSPYRAILFS